MSTDPTKKIPPLPSQDMPQEPPTQPVPQRSTPPPPPPPPGSGAPRRGRPEPPAAPTPRYDDQQTRIEDQGTQGMPTRMEQSPPTQWDRPQRPADRATAAPGQWNQPRGNQPPGNQPPGNQPPQWQGPQDGPTPQWSPQQQPPAGQQPPASPPRRKRRVRRSVMAVFAVLVLLILLVIGDRVALAVTENDMAGQFQANGLPTKPSVTIEGFPFLTQLAAKDFNKVDISASNVPVSLPTGGNLSITSIKATINGLHISSYSSTASARVDSMNATVFVSFNSLAAAGGLGDGTGVTFSPVNSNTVKVTASLAGLVSDSEDVQLTVTGPQTISVKVLSSGALGSVLGSLGSFSFNLPKGVPPTLKITSLTLNSQGVTASASATNATFSPSPSPSSSPSK